MEIYKVTLPRLIEIIECHGVGNGIVFTIPPQDEKSENISFFYTKREALQWIFDCAMKKMEEAERQQNEAHEVLRWYELRVQEIANE